MNVRLEIVLQDIDSESVRSRLAELPEMDGVAWTTPHEANNKPSRVLQPAVLVAIVGAAGTALGALITGLLALAKERKVGVISVSAGGVTISMPQNASVEQVQRVLELIRSNKDAKLLIDPNA
jgi:hypothetical protein